MNTEHNIEVIPNVFDRAKRIPVIAFIEEGVTLKDLLIKQGKISNPESFIVYCNGKQVEDYSLKLKHEDKLIILPRVAGGDDGKGILGAVLMIALVVAAPYMINAIPGMASYAGLGAAFRAGNMLWMASYMGVVVGGGLLIGSITSQNIPNTSYDTSNAYGWSPSTTQRQGIAVPVIYGKMRTHGNIISAYTENTTLDNGDSSQVLNVLIALSSGPIHSIDGHKINRQPIDEYDDIETETRVGLINQTPVSGFGDTILQIPFEREVDYGDPEALQSENSNFTILKVDIAFPSGVYRINNEGERKGYTIHYRIEYKKATDQDWTQHTETYISDSHVGALRRTYAIEGLSGEDKYDVRVTKLTDEPGDTTRYGYKMYVTALKEVQEDDYQYPKTALIGIKALATSDISGSLDYSGIIKGKLIRIYDGASWTIDWTDNPAWICYDILTQPVITGNSTDGYDVALNSDGSIRYDGMNATILDLDAFKEWADYCDDDVLNEAGENEKRHTCNLIFDTTASLWENAVKVFACGTAEPVWRGTRLSLWIDRADSPVGLVTADNIVEGTYTEHFLKMEDRVSELELNFLDETDDYEQASLSVHNIEVGTENKASLQLLGTTRPTEIWRRAYYQLQQNLLLKKTIEFEMDVEGIAFTAGDIINVQKNIVRYGDSGRIVDVEFYPAVTGVLWTEDKGVVSWGTTDEISLFWQGNTYIIATGSTTDDYIYWDEATPNLFLTTNDFEVAYSHQLIADNSGGVPDLFNQNYLTLDHTPDLSSVTNPVITIRLSQESDNGSLLAQTLNIVSQNENVLQVSQFASYIPVNGDSVTIGDSGDVVKPYRVKSLSKTSDLRLSIIAVEYNENVYLGDTQTPVIPSPAKTPGGSSSYYVTGLAAEEYNDITELGVFRRYINVSFTKPVGVDRVELHYKTSSSTVWVLADSTMNEQGVIAPVTANTEYQIKAVSVDNYGYRTDWDSSPTASITTGSVYTGVTLDAVVVGGYVVDDTKPDIKVRWSDLRSAEDDLTGLPDTSIRRNTWLKDYQVKVYDESNNLLRAEYVEFAEYIYTMVNNKADDTSDVNRILKFEVRPRDYDSRVGSVVHTINFSQLAPAVLLNIVGTPIKNGFSLQWQVNTESDMSGYIVYAGTDTSSMSEVYRGIQNYCDVSVSTAGTYYYKVAAYDTFSDLDLNFSTPVQVIVTEDNNLPDFSMPVLSNIAWSESGNDISWAKVNSGKNITVLFQGVQYTITAGTTDKQYIYWDENYKTSGFQLTDTLSNATAAGCWLLAYNDSGTIVLPQSNKLWHGALVQANTITGNQIKADAIQAAHIASGTITADKYAQLRQSMPFTGDDSLDSSYPFELPFLIVAETTNIVSVKLSFTILPYRAYSKTTVNDPEKTESSSGPANYSPTASTENSSTLNTSNRSLTTNSDGSGSTDSAYIYSTPDDHDHNIGSHNHSIDSHNHSVPAHKHDLTSFGNTHSHDVTFPAHNHGINFGIHEESASPTIGIYVDNGSGYGALVGNYTANQIDINLTSLITGTGWRKIKFTSNQRCRISGIVVVKVDITA